MDTNTRTDIGDDELDAVVGGTVSAPAKPVDNAKGKTTDVVEHREGGDHITH